MSKTYDAVIIGGGHNGLVAAAYLAKAGKDVLVLEQRHVLGGAAVTEEVFPGFRFSVFSYVVSLLRPHIIRDLELSKHGLEIIPLEASFLPLLDGRSLCRWSDPHETRREIANFSAKDAEIYPEFGMTMMKMARFAKNIIDNPAPDPTSLRPRELMHLMSLGRHFQQLDPDDMVTHLQMLTMSAVDFLDMWFESDVLKAPMSVSGIIGTFLGVRSPGTAYVLLHHYMGEIDGAFRAWGFSKGGTGQVSLSIANAAKSFGAEIRTEAPVERILMKGNEAQGVVLQNGDEIKAKAVLSSVDPRLTFFKFMDQNQLPDEFTEQIGRYKFRGSSGKVNLALDRFPDFACRPGSGPHMQGDIAICPSIEYLEKAYDQAKYGEFSERPYMNIVIPSLVDPTVAPPGKHVMSIFVQYAPYNIKEGADKWPEKREAFGDAVVNELSRYCPGLKESILHRQVLTPWDIEKMIGLSEGNIFQGELSMEQLLFLRPASGWARYKTPVQNLWMCGSATHPGGGVMGSPGELAAKTLLNSRTI
ncbi:MAG: NAD(P)/FAD-dependent oxidoreductase [Candidatus Eisenbacteria bacterium]|uniref:Pyridine nucleotide-disulfide oxidoreductase domain-containing protein 2 n=1 Tax=Eiseniibacteriota bacterium TaxID=2212470 RepID=A0A7Y2E9I7_UNCEI|nr:NAD(P)/FAD-dependent oxidoreductase [Candidatus Eisenbacteria bacterium]